MSAVRLTRLPLCQRMGTEGKNGTFQNYPDPRMQTLLYLNPHPDPVPIADRMENTDFAGPIDPSTADNDGFDTGRCA
jgi:hypothetical protein